MKYNFEKRVLIPFCAEFKKQILSTEINLSYVMSTLIWPFLSLFVNVYTFYSFEWSTFETFNSYSTTEILLYLFTGGLAINCFFSMNASAYQVVYEKIDNTIELIFQSPASRLAVIYGRAAGAFVQFTWVYIIYSLMIIIVGKLFSNYILLNFFFIYLFMLAASIVWGAFCTSLFLISRQSGFLFTLANLPQELLSGSLFPVQIFPYFLIFISSLLPISYCIRFIREIVIEQNKLIVTEFIRFLILLITIEFVTYILLKVSERNLKKENSYNFY